MTELVSKDNWIKAAAMLNDAAVLLGDTRRLTHIQLVAAFTRGLKTVEEIPTAAVNENWQ